MFQMVAKCIFSGALLPQPGRFRKTLLQRSVYSLRLTWKLPEGLSKWNQVFQRSPGSFHVSLGWRVCCKGLGGDPPPPLQGPQAQVCRQLRPMLRQLLRHTPLEARVRRFPRTRTPKQKCVSVRGADRFWVGKEKPGGAVKQDLLSWEHVGIGQKSSITKPQV